MAVNHLRSVREEEEAAVVGIYHIRFLLFFCCLSFVIILVFFSVFSLSFSFSSLDYLCLYVVVFSALVIFTSVVSHVISSHVAKDCGSYKPTNPGCLVLRLTFSCICSLCNNQSIRLVLGLCLVYSN